MLILHLQVPRKYKRISIIKLFDGMRKVSGFIYLEEKSRYISIFKQSPVKPFVTKKSSRWILLWVRKNRSFTCC